MKLAAFEMIAKPHRDISRGNFTPDTYAAKLGQVVKKKGSPEYRSAQQFFEKTYMTDGLKRLLSGVEGRLKGRERQNQDPIIQLQTPFGGGKTHTLIALYHKAMEWDVTPITIIGSEMDTTDSFWGQIETQLTGSIANFGGLIAPGSNSISELFSTNDKPVMILMDEVLNYLARAAGVSVESSTLANQTIAFMLSLTEAVASSPNVVFVVTLQESEIAPITSDFPLFNDLLGRMKRTVTPVGDGEIASIIRKRLFSEINQKEARNVVRQFAKYARAEGILPSGTQESQYREQFIESYPFQPEVIDVLYHRWGSFPNFHRTRGVLRFLSRIVHRACGKNRPYITLADFDLGDSDIREELLEHIDKQYRSVIASDIIGHNAGAKAADKALGDTYGDLELGTRTATTIFLYSFTGGIERGATLNEIKRSTALIDQPAAIIDSSRNQLTEHLFYLRTENGTSYFDTQPNLKRIVRTRTENVDPEAVEAHINAQLRRSFKSIPNAKLRTYILPKDSTDIPDTDELKLVVLSKQDDEFCQNLIEYRGETPRIYRNTLFFIVPASGEAKQLKTEVKRVIAYEEIKKDSSVNLSNTQIKEINDVLKQSNNALNNAVRQDYRTVLILEKEGFTEEDLGLPAAGMNAPFDETVYEMLCVKGQILTSIGPRNIWIRYLKDNDTVSTSQLFHSSLRTPGEPRILRDAWVKGIHQGVQDGIFGLGDKAEGKLIPRYFTNNSPEVTLDNGEVIIQPNLIRESITPEEVLKDYLKENETISTSYPFQYNQQSANESRPLHDMWESAIREGVRKGAFGIGDKIGDELIPRVFMQELPLITWNDNEVIIQSSLCTSLIADPAQPDLKPDSPAPDPQPVPVVGSTTKAIGIRFTVPQGKVSNVAQHINQLQSNFQNIQIELKASNGEISQDAYEELKENLRALGIEIEEV